MRRTAGKAGSWYASSPSALRREVDACLARGAELFGAPAVPPGRKPAAVVVPHAGLAYSGAVAGVAYDLLRRAWERVDTFILFGACHRARLREPALWARGAWETPLGEIAVDEALAERFLEGGIGRAFPEAHADDNALELQTPFIKHLFPEAKILPVAMGFFRESPRIGELASRLARESGGTAVAVASTDCTHYGAAFGLMPAGTGERAAEWTRANDARFLETLLRLDLEAIIPRAERDRSACGAGAAAAAAGWARERGCAEGRLLAAANSHDVAPRGEADHIVGYASLAFDVTA